MATSADKPVAYFSTAPIAPKGHAMDQASLKQRIVEAHNKMYLALEISPANIQRIELARVRYLDVVSPLKVRYRFQAGVVDDASYRAQMREHERDLILWQIAYRQWEELETRRKERNRADGVKEPFTDALKGLGYGGPKKPSAPERKDFVHYHTVEEQTTTENLRITGRLFDASRAFSSRSDNWISDFESKYLVTDPDLLPDIKVNHGSVPEYSPNAVLRNLSDAPALKCAESQAERYGCEFYRGVQVLDAHWINEPNNRTAYFLRAHISDGSIIITTEVGISGGGVVLGCCLTDKKKVAKLTAVGIAVAMAFVGLMFATLRYFSLPSKTESIAESNNSVSPTLASAAPVPEGNALPPTTIAASTSPPSRSVEASAPPSNVDLIDDEASILSKENQENINQKLVAFSKETTHQIGVLTVPSLDGESINSFALRKAKVLGLGTKERNNGILIVVALKERQVRIELGLGFEKYISNEMCSEIIKTQMAPLFKEGRYADGLDRGTEALMRAVDDHPELTHLSGPG